MSNSIRTAAILHRLLVVWEMVRGLCPFDQDLPGLGQPHTSVGAFERWHTALAQHAAALPHPWQRMQPSVLLSAALAGLPLGIALASAPGPVQAVLLAEALRRGARRGLRAMAGANLTFGVLLVGLALGVRAVPPSGSVLSLLELAGGVLLVGLAVDGFRSAYAAQTAAEGSTGLPPEVRGILAVVLNPGAWLFLGIVAAPLFASVAATGGTVAGLSAAVALMFGVGVGDATIVAVGGIGVRRARAQLRARIRQALALVLAALGAALLVQGVLGLQGSAP